MQLRDVTLDDKYTREDGQIFVTGIQALVRLPMLQAQWDRRSGLNTAGFVTGYRGSPLGGLDQQLHAANGFLAQHAVRFQPAVNEDLGATAVWGTQQSGLNGDSHYDGVFAMWYAKGPGVDRSGIRYDTGTWLDLLQRAVYCSCWVMTIPVSHPQQPIRVSTRWSMQWCQY